MTMISVFAIEEDNRVLGLFSSRETAQYALDTSKVLHKCEVFEWPLHTGLVTKQTRYLVVTGKKGVVKRIERIDHGEHYELVSDEQRIQMLAMDMWKS